MRFHVDMNSVRCLMSLVGALWLKPRPFLLQLLQLRVEVCQGQSDLARELLVFLEAVS